MDRIWSDSTYYMPLGTARPIVSLCNFLGQERNLFKASQIHDRNRTHCCSVKYKITTLYTFHMDNLEGYLSFFLAYLRHFLFQNGFLSNSSHAV